MAKKDIHEEIVSILLDLCKGDKGYEKSYMGDSRHRLGFVTPTTSKPIPKQYQPDVIAVWRGGRYKDIFEVWHSEPEGDAVADILYPVLHRAQNKEIKYLCIVCTGYNQTKEQADALKSLILENLRDKNGNELFVRTDIYVTEIPENIQQDRLKMKKFLFQELEFNK